MRFNSSHDSHAGDPSDRPGAASQLNNPKLRCRSVVDCSVRLTGDLWSEGDVQIDGHLCGNISCMQLIVGKDAAVTGVIIAQEAVIRGKMTGIIRATRVLLQGTARVESEIIYQSLSVDEGVSFEGIARQRPNPLVEDFAVTATTEARQRIRTREPDTTGNGTGVDCETAGQAGPLAAAEARRQLPGPAADA
jgi:cytoskeletal protein CcmA (bactofilin family)